MPRFILTIFVTLFLAASVALAASPDVRSKAAVWIEAETAKPAAGIDVDGTKPADVVSGGVLGVHPDKTPRATARWEFAVTAPVKAACLGLRHAANSDATFNVRLDGKPLGRIVLPGTGGWGKTVAEWSWRAVPLGLDLEAGTHTLDLEAVGKASANLDSLAILAGSQGVAEVALQPVAATPAKPSGESSPKAGAGALPDWTAPAAADVEATPFEIGGEAKFKVWGWGSGGAHREFFDELLPAVFERTLVLDTCDLAGGRLEWILTGERGGFTIQVDANAVTVFQRFYDSPAFNFMGGKPGRYPEWRAQETVCPYTGTLRAITVRMDHKFGLSVALNGRTVAEQECMLDFSRHQLRVSDAKGRAAGRMLRPTTQAVEVRVDSAARHQTMIGFGGIASSPAYAQLSPEGRRQWWDLVARYNLLIQREYPNGQRLSEAMDNWDRLADATPHYYGDNFPNGELSDFQYNRTIRRLGGKVWFEFWALPPWVGKDAEKYAQAMVRYCQIAKEKAGAPPEVVGIQNEITQSAEQWHAMTLALRRALDAAGFKGVPIHMSDSSSLAGGLKNIRAFQASKEAWAAVDFAATHMYDFQSCFTKPDDFDGRLKEWAGLAAGKPFLSTELCINNNKYQWPTYRVALTMGQLYHKNLVLTDAVAIAYCWTLLNVEQPSFGWTRTLCVPDPAHGFVPVATSGQLRVFGAYSRRIREGMVRVTAETAAEDLLVSAFEGKDGARTVVLLNRAVRPREVRIAWPGGRLTEIELADPYHENSVDGLIDPSGEPAGRIIVPPGAVVTVTNVPLGRLPEHFDPAGH